MRCPSHQPLLLLQELWYLSRTSSMTLEGWTDPLRPELSLELRDSCRLQRSRITENLLLPTRSHGGGGLSSAPLWGDLCVCVCTCARVCVVLYVLKHCYLYIWSCWVLFFGLLFFLCGSLEMVSFSRHIHHVLLRVLGWKRSRSYLCGSTQTWSCRNWTQSETWLFCMGSVGLPGGVSPSRRPSSALKANKNLQELQIHGFRFDIFVILFQLDFHITIKSSTSMKGPRRISVILHIFSRFVPV